ncbi:hypothetical protein OAK07_00675 [Marine Group III euryarchaeote]|nr:hypothetical protein [Marine Group III euryarchaeote]
MKYYSYLAYLSYFLLIVNTVIASDPTVPLYGILLSLGTIFSFSIYIYLRKNDERFEFLFLKNFNVVSLLQVCLLIPLLIYSILSPFGDFKFILIIIPYWLVFFSLSFEKVEDESVPPLSFSKKVFKFALNLLAFIFFCIFFMMISYPGNWIDSDTYYIFSIMPAWFCIVCIYFGRRIE